MINQQVIPLINDRMIPLIDNDISKLENSLHAIKLILEADRDLHQVLVAEKRSLAASEDEMQPVIKSHKENITQALNRMSNAFDLISHDHQISKLYKQFSESFTIWQSKTEAVLAKIVIPSKRKFALKGSNGGSAEKTFTAMRHIVDKMQQRVEQMIVEQKQIIANNRAAIEAERESVLVKRDMIIAEKRSIDEKKSLGTTNFLKVKSTIESINTTFYSLAIISLIISIIAAVMIGNRIARPVIEATKFATKIGQGNLSIRLGLKRNDELGTLSTALDAMADNLEEKSILAEKISVQDLSGTIELVSDEDSLGKSLQQMTQNLNRARPRIA